MDEKRGVEMELFLLRAGEYMLKKGTRPFFEKQLRSNLKRTLKPFVKKINLLAGRIYVQHHAEYQNEVEQVLAKTFGISDFHLAYASELSLESIQSSINSLLEKELKLEGITFKVEAKRTNKSFAIKSYDLAASLGGWLLDLHPSWKVNVRTPQLSVMVEIREQAYVYLVWNQQRRGAGGLPIGTTGRGVLMLSGGIDSPVASYMMNKRGLNLVAVHFHTPPYTGSESLEKVQQLATALAPWNCGKLALYTINFTEIQLKIQQIPKPEFTTIVSRIMMMKIAQLIMHKEDARALITGEALGQVASQTLESLQVTDALSQQLVLRPCVGMDKQEIIYLAQKIDTFDTSIIPASDCCSLFAPDHPSTRPKIEEVSQLILQLEVDELIANCFAAAQITVYPPRSS
jgi:tRNA uracil 4-sulfurtransferase